MSSEYASIPSTGKLKLKGVKDSAITKSKKKKAKTPTTTTTTTNTPQGENEDETPGKSFQDNSVVLRTLEEEDRQIAKSAYRKIGVVDGKEVLPGSGIEDDDPDVAKRVKTESERRHQEQRRKRLEDRLLKEGVKTHKQRVEELNKYLSGLSEHHDMPKIGPG